jgi:hypothetical protein
MAASGAKRLVVNARETTERPEKCRPRCVHEGLARRAAAARCPQNVLPLITAPGVTR